MASADQLMTWATIQAEVAAGRMTWGAANPPTGLTQIMSWQSFRYWVTNDGTNPQGLADSLDPRYDALLARTQVAPNNVTMAFAGNCGSCNYNCTGSWSGRPAGWSAYVSFNGGAFVNKGAVDSFTAAAAGKNSPASFTVYFSNGATQTPSVASNTITTPNCTGCPS